MVFIYMFILNVGLFFLSIPIPVFIPSDRFDKRSGKAFLH